MSQEIRSTHMSRRGLLGAAALAPAPFGILRARARESRPNILFLMDDQHRGDCLGADGNRAIHTPNLDRIARDGIRFSAAYTSTPSCTPARSALLTGLAPWNHGMLGYGRVAARYPLEMPRALAEAGYYAMAIGKLHYAPQRNLHGYHAALLDESGRVESPDFRSDYRAWFWSEAPGLDPDATGIGFNDYRGRAYVLPERLHPTHWMGRCAVRFLEQYNKPQPFFLKVSFARPHSPYDPPGRWYRHYAEADLPEPPAGRWAEPYRKRSDPSNNIWHGDMGAETITSRRCYYGSVSFIDEQVGRILETLDKRGWLENTLVLYTSDHGDMTGDHHMWRKTYAYEGSARIPMLLRVPKGLASGPRGAVAPQPVELRDILPTFLEAAGVPLAREIDGRSLLALARGNPAGWREVLDLEHCATYSPENQWTALTDGRWKYIFHAFHGNEQLFDRQSDPHELTDLSGSREHEAELRKWRSRMIEHLSPRGEPFVKGGKLGIRRERTLYSPNYPKAETGRR